MKRNRSLLTLLLVTFTTLFYAQTATDSCGIWLNCTEFSFYINKVYECEDLKADTSNLQFQISKYDQETTKLHESISAGKMALGAKQESLKTVQIANEKLTARAINAEAKVRFWKTLGVTTIIVFVIVEGVRIALEMVKP